MYTSMTWSVCEDKCLIFSWRGWCRVYLGDGMIGVQIQEEEKLLGQKVRLELDYDGSGHLNFMLLQHMTNPQVLFERAQSRNQEL